MRKALAGLVWLCAMGLVAVGCNDQVLAPSSGGPGRPDFVLKHLRCAGTRRRTNRGKAIGRILAVSAGQS